jgi:hypothetical protein
VLAAAFTSTGEDTCATWGCSEKRNFSAKVSQFLAQVSWNGKNQKPKNGKRKTEN